jgi:hypothetical protein
MVAAESSLAGLTGYAWYSWRMWAGDGRSVRQARPTFVGTADPGEDAGASAPRSHEPGCRNGQWLGPPNVHGGPQVDGGLGSVRACPWLRAGFCPCGLGVRAFLSVRPASAGAVCPCNWRLRAFPAADLASLSVDPAYRPVRYLSVTTVAMRPSMTPDDTGWEKANGPRIRRLGRSRAVFAGGGRCWVRTNVG